MSLDTFSTTTRQAIQLRRLDLGEDQTPRSTACLYYSIITLFPIIVALLHGTHCRQQGPVSYHPPQITIYLRTVSFNHCFSQSPGEDQIPPPLEACLLGLCSNTLCSIPARIRLLLLPRHVFIIISLFNHKCRRLGVPTPFYQRDLGEDQTPPPSEACLYP